MRVIALVFGAVLLSFDHFSNGSSFPAMMHRGYKTEDLSQYLSRQLWSSSRTNLVFTAPLCWTKTTQDSTGTNWKETQRYRLGRRVQLKYKIALIKDNLSKMKITCFLLLFAGIVNSQRPSTFRCPKRYPDQDEHKVCSRIRDVIPRDSGRFRKILIRNTNNEAQYANDDCRRMTARSKSKLDILASRVPSEWRGQSVRVLRAWTDQVNPKDQTSLHYEGMLIVEDCTVLQYCTFTCNDFSPLKRFIPKTDNRAWFIVHLLGKKVRCNFEKKKIIWMEQSVKDLNKIWIAFTTENKHC
jgi:hypothetical protein